MIAGGCVRVALEKKEEKFRVFRLKTIRHELNSNKKKQDFSCYLSRIQKVKFFERKKMDKLSGINGARRVHAVPYFS